MKGQRSEKVKGHGRLSSLPSYRARKSALTKGASRNVRLMTQIVFAIVLLVVLATLWKVVSRGSDNAGGLQLNGIAAEESAQAAASTTATEGNADKAAGLGLGTDVYHKTRDDEILATWHPRLGLEIDAWDPRTHDPRVNSSKFGDKVKPLPQEQKFSLTAVVVSRIASGDASGISLYECRQWLEYMRYAGVEHVFWYDAAHSMTESQERGLRPYIQKGFMTYHHFHKLFPGSINLGYGFKRDKSLVHCLNSYGQRTRWLAAVDVDEYIFVPRDTTPGFLDRYLRDYEDEFPEVSQMLLQCIVFEGPPTKPPPALVVERFQMRAPGTLGVSLGAASAMKSLIRPRDTERVYTADPHHFEMHTGKTVAQAAASVRLNRYRGLRRLNASSEMPVGLVEDSSMQPIAEELKQLLHVARGTRSHR